MIASVGLFYGRRPRGPNWYVDAVAGNDANSGKSRGTALRTIAAVMPRIAAGDTVGLARGSRWREQFTVPAAGVKVVPYGAGDPPLLDCSDPVVAGAWSKTAGRTSVYQASVTHDIAINKTFIGCWEDDVRLQWKTSLTDVDATPGSYTLSDTGGAPASPVTLCVHASDGASPAANGRRYEYSSRNFGLTASGMSYCTIRGIQTRRNMHADGSLVLGNFNTAIDCLASEGQYHSVFVSPGCYLVNVVANEAYHPAAIGMFIWDPVGNGEDITFENCQALLPAFVPGLGGGFGGHGAGTLGTITYKNCVVRNCDEAFEGTLASRLVVQDCQILGACSTGVAAYNPTQVTVQNLSADSVFARLVTAISNGATVSISGLAATSSNGATAVYANGLNNITLTIADSILTGFTVASCDNSPGLALTFLRNRIVTGPWNLFWLNPAPVSIDSDYNAVYAGAHLQWGASNYSWADYKQMSGQDADSTP